MKTVYICAAHRTAIGSFQGSLSSLKAPLLASKSISACLHKLDPQKVDEVLMGCVLSAGVGQAPARQAALGAQLPESVPCTTIGKVCGSGLKSVMLAESSIKAGENNIVLAGGMENMSQAPYLVPKMRNGLRLGHGELVDSMIKDGLWDVYSDVHMGIAAELCAEKYQISREAQDAYAIESYERAQQSLKSGSFSDEIVPIEIKKRKENLIFKTDEEAEKFDKEKFLKLRGAFKKDGTITAGNASSLSDGASCLLLASEESVKKENLTPLARIVAQSQAAQDPTWFTTAPAASIQIALKKAQLDKNQIDYWEINEAFAAVALVNRNLLELNPEQVNPRGGAIALGHPIGASGARILTTLIHALKQDKKKYGLASLCIGGGEATSLVVENLER